MMFQRTRLVNELLAHKDNGRIKILSGVRRCGKSYLLNHLYRQALYEQGVRQEDILFLALDEIQNNDNLNPLTLEKTIRQFMEGKKHVYVFLDEVQKVFRIKNPVLTNGRIVLAKRKSDSDITFGNVLSGFADNPQIDLYVTGSNSHMLSSEMVTEFRDRGDEIRVYPLSYEEILEGEQPSETALNHYLTYGGMPYAAELRNDAMRQSYLKELYLVTYRKDILELHHPVEYPQHLETLVRLLASINASEVSVSTLEKTFTSKGSKEMTAYYISRYLSYLEESFLISQVEERNIRGKKNIGRNKKVYFTDVGLRNALLDFASPDLGHGMENVIYLELLRRGFQVETGKIDRVETDQNNNRVRKNLECDFIAARGNERFYLQSCLSLYDPKKEKAELASLLSIHDAFPKILILYESVPMYRTEEGVIVVSLSDFLLHPEMVGM